MWWGWGFTCLLHKIILSFMDFSTSELLERKQSSIWQSQIFWNSFTSLAIIIKLWLWPDGFVSKFICLIVNNFLFGFQYKSKSHHMISLFNYYSAKIDIRYFVSKQKGKNFYQSIGTLLIFQKTIEESRILHFIPSSHGSINLQR